jgi:hypothetical protein
MKQLTVRVTRFCIEYGQKRTNSCCAIACALLVDHPEFRHVKVTAETIIFTDTSVEPKLRYYYRTPTVAANFLRDWDNDLELTALTFVLKTNDRIETREVKPSPVTSRIRPQRNTGKGTQRRARPATLVR